LFTGELTRAHSDSTDKGCLAEPCKQLTAYQDT